MAITPTRIQLARYTAAQWVTANPILLQGEPGWEIDTDLMKIGDGVTAWNNLGYFSPGNANANQAGVVAYADNRTNTPTIGAPNGNAVTGCVIYVAASDVGNMDLYLEFGGMTTVTAGGQGIIQLTVADWSGGVTPSGSLQTALATFLAGQPAVTYGPSVYHKVRIGKITSDKIYGLGVSTTQQTSSLAGGMLNGIIEGSTAGCTWIKATVE